MNNVVRVPILNDEYKVIVCWGEADEIEHVLRLYCYPKDERHMEYEWNARGRCFHHHGCYPVVAMPCAPSTPTQIATLAHEATHAVCGILNTIGATIDGEVLAHSVGAVVRHTLTHIEKMLSQK